MSRLPLEAVISSIPAALYGAGKRLRAIHPAIALQYLVVSFCRDWAFFLGGEMSVHHGFEPSTHWLCVKEKQ